MVPLFSRALLIFQLVWIVACASPTPKEVSTVGMQDWAAIEQQARGTTVRMMMWQGDPLINRYMEDWVVPRVKEQLAIDLQLLPGQGNEVVKRLLAEKEAGKQVSSFDLCWINGETFFQLRQLDALMGPFTQLLPNSQYINFQNPFIGIDFQQPVEGYECPWGNVQLALIYDSLRTPQPPQTLQELENWVKANPGKFTIPYEFTGMTLLKSWMIGLSGDPAILNGPFDESKYQALSASLFQYLERLRPYLWRQGSTFPASLSATHQLFANGELAFTMSNNDSEVDNKIQQGIFPGSAKSFVFKSGTIQNAHYLGIPAHTPQAAGALAVVNFLISPEAQLQKLQPSVWGDGTVLDISRLPEPWRSSFQALPERKNAVPRSVLQTVALQEPAPEYMLRLSEDFRKRMLQ